MPMPQSPGAQLDSPNPTPGGPPSSPGSSLLGPDSLPQPSPTPEQQNEAFMLEIQELTQRITALARQFPASAENWEIAIQSLIEGMTKTVIASQTTEPSMAPNLVG